MFYFYIILFMIKEEIKKYERLFEDIKNTGVIKMQG